MGMCVNHGDAVGTYVGHGDTEEMCMNYRDTEGTSVSHGDTEETRVSCGDTGGDVCEPWAR